MSSDMTANLNTLGKAHSRLNDNASHHDNTAGATGFDTDYPQSSADNGGVWVSESSYSSTTQVAGEEPRTTGWRGHEEGVIDAKGEAKVTDSWGEKLGNEGSRRIEGA